MSSAHTLLLVEQDPSYLATDETASDVRQCIIYESGAPNARIIGIEYMISPHLYETLPQDERRLWHSHVFEVKSGMLVMPQNTAIVPSAAWDAAETKEMEQVIRLYGKIYHLWQVDRGDVLPLGEPQLMTSCTAEGQLDRGLWQSRDEKLGISTEKKKELRKHIPEPDIHPGELPYGTHAWEWKTQHNKTD